MATETAKLSVSPELFNIYPSSSPESCIQVTNVSFVPVLYRALSTAPKQFQVRPRQGIIEPGKSTTIIITFTSKGSDDAATTERKEEFKIEYCRMTAEHDTAVKAGGADTKDIVTDLIKASAKTEKKSKVVTCMIKTVDAPASSATATPKPAEAEKKAEAPSTAAPRVSERVEATTDALTGKTSAVAAGDEAGLRSRASAALPTPAAGRPSTSDSVAKDEKKAEAVLPEKKEKNSGAGAVSITSDPVAFLKQNPLFVIGGVIVLFLLLKTLF